VLFGPVITAAQAERVTGFLDRLPDHADASAGGHRLDEPGFFHEATVVAGCGRTTRWFRTRCSGR
jgi:betaine-aldehyde dehydrogenase